tara:strand:- start:1127 stop:1567 length:441 start_codon:yes stop_codon:yes gene_type:complete
MNNGRHVVVESPDGNMSIGTNPDIEAPPNIESQPYQDPHMEIYVKYNYITRAILWTFSWFGAAGLIYRRSMIDILNTVFLIVTIYSVQSERAESRPILAIHSFYCFALVPIAAVFEAWWDVCYLFALGIHLMITINQSKLNIREIR